MTKSSNENQTKIIVFFLVISLIFIQTSCVFGAQSETSQASANSFSDLKDSHWAYKNIQTLVSLGGIKGYPDGTFKSEGTITYSELVSILLGATGNDVAVSDGNWAQGIMQKAYASKIIDSKTVPLTDANKPVTREIMAVMLSNSAKELRGESLTMLNDMHLYVRDFALTDLDYRNYVNQCFASGLLQGNTWSQFKPQNNLTRAEAATICVRLLDEKERLTPTKFSELEKEYNVIAQGTNISDYVKQPEWAKMLTDIVTGESNYKVLDNGNKFGLKLLGSESGWFSIQYVCSGKVVLFDTQGNGIARSLPHTSGETVTDAWSVDLSTVKYFIFTSAEDMNYIVPNTLQ